MYASADRGVGVSEPRFAFGSRDTEVDQIGEIVLGDEDVRRLDVAVHQPDSVCGEQCERDLPDDPDGTLRSQRTGSE